MTTVIHFPIKTVNKYFLLTVHCSLFMIYCSCNKEDAWDIVKTRGEHVVEERAINAFRAITVKNGINVVLSQGNNDAATIDGWKNLMPKIKLSMKKNGVLLIEDVNKSNFVRSRDNMTTVYLTVSGEIDSVHFSGNGYFLTNDTLFTSRLTVISFGSGSVDITVKTPDIYVATNHGNTASITIRGQGNSAGITNWGYAPVDLSGFETLYASVAQNGLGNIFVNASQSIDAVFYRGSGNVYYAANPSSVTFIHKGKAKGNLYRMEDETIF